MEERKMSSDFNNPTSTNESRGEFNHIPCGRGQPQTQEERVMPVLLARVSEDGINMIIWCPFCRCSHFYGTGSDPTGKAGEGHRVAHCINESSPFKGTGYILKLDREWEKMKQATKSARVKPTVACNHAQPLDVLSDALNRNAEVSSLLEIASRALFDSGVAR